MRIAGFIQRCDKRPLAFRAIIFPTECYCSIRTPHLVSYRYTLQLGTKQFSLPSMGHAETSKQRSGPLVPHLLTQALQKICPQGSSCCGGFIRQPKHTVWLVKLRTSPCDTCLKNAGSIRSRCTSNTHCSLSTSRVVFALSFAVRSASLKYVSCRNFCMLFAKEKDETYSPSARSCPVLDRCPFAP